MLEQELISLAAPTLAGIKPASLFTAHISVSELTALRRKLHGLQLTVLRRQGKKKLLYLYQPEQLSQIMRQHEVQQFLARRDYTGFTIEGLLHQLRIRLLTADSFPHEIGLFLGYPLEDVQGFIRHHGQDCLLSGCWKVYSNPEEAQRTFEAYRTCRQQLLQRHAEGIPLSQLTAQAPSDSAPHCAAAPQYWHSTESFHESSRTGTPDTRRRTSHHAPLRRRVPDSARSAPIPAHSHRPQCSPDTTPARTFCNPCSTRHRP